MTVGQVDHTVGVVDVEDEAPAAATRPQSWWRRPSVWLVVGSVVFAAVAFRTFGRPYTFFDMRIYHGAMEWWSSGRDLYEYVSPVDLGFTYPPFAAVAMVPMSSMSYLVAAWVNTVLSVAALAVVLAVLLLPIADRCGWPRWPTIGVAVPLAIAMEPTRETIGFGQVNLLLFGLVIADLVALRWQARRELGRGPGDRRRRPAARAAIESPARAVAMAAGEALRRFWFSGSWAGVGIGLATAVKLTPGLFIIYLLVSRQRRTALVASATAVGASIAAWLVAPRESVAYFTSVLWQTDRVGNADATPNQSLAGVLARLYDSMTAPGLLWMSFAALCLALGISRAVAAHKDGDELASFTLVGMTATIISPISWSHHLVFVIPAVIVLMDAALRRHAAGRGNRLPGPPATPGWLRQNVGLWYGAGAVAAYVLFVISPIWWLNGHRLPDGSHYSTGLLGVLAENSLALGMILLVAVMPWRPGAEPAPRLLRADHELRFMIGAARRP